MRPSDVIPDLLESRLFKRLGHGGWIRHVAEEMELDLLAIVEGAAQLERIAFLHAEPLLEEIKPGPAPGAQRRAGHNNARNLAEELLM